MSSKPVFVSYSNENKGTADAVLRALEAQGISCWMAPRDIPPGDTWAKAIVDGIRQSLVMVMVFSEATRSSDHVAREIHLAVEAGAPVFLFRTDHAELSSELSYFLSTHQFVDLKGSPKPSAAQLGHLVASVKKVLREKGVKIAEPRKRSWKGRAARAAAMLALLYVTVVGGFLAIDEWLDHGKSPVEAGWSALGALVRPSEVAAATLDDLRTAADPGPLAEADSACEELRTMIQVKTDLDDEEADELALLMHQAARVEEFLRRRAKAPWLFPDKEEGGLEELVVLYRGFKSPSAEPRAQPATPRLPREERAAEAEATTGGAADPGTGSGGAGS